MSFSLNVRRRGQSDLHQEKHPSEDSARAALDKLVQAHTKQGHRVEQKKIGHQRLTEVSDQQGLVASYWISDDD
jgi:hypothetical protein